VVVAGEGATNVGLADLYQQYIVDPITGLLTPNPQNAELQQATTAQGLDPNDPRLQGTTFEGPTTPIDTQERNTLFPKGLPSPQHQGGLAQLAAQSMAGGPAQELKNQTPGPEQHPTTNTRAGQTKWLTNAPDAMAKADAGQRESRAYGDIGYSVGSAVRLAASAGAGGGAGAGAGGGAAGGAAGGVDAGAAAGTSAGASSGAGYGGGTGSSLMDAYNAYQQYGGSGGGGGGSGGGGSSGGSSGYLMQGEAPHGRGGGSGMSGTGAEISFDLGNAGKRRSALAMLGYLPQFSPQLQTGDNYFYA
jgi:hypothetical protein